MRVTLIDPDQVLLPVEQERLRVRLRYAWIGSGLSLRRVAMRIYCLAGRRGLEYVCQLRIELEPSGEPLVVESASPSRRNCVQEACLAMHRALKRRRARFDWSLFLRRWRIRGGSRRGRAGRWGRMVTSGS